MSDLTVPLRVPDSRAGSPTISWARRIGAAALLGAGMIHLSVFPAHLDEWWAAGLFFGGITVVQLVVAAAFALCSRRALAGVVAVVVATNTGSVLLWLLSRMWGVPLGPEAGAREPVGLPGLLTVLLELLAVAAALSSLRATGRRFVTSPGPRADMLATGALGAALAAIVIPGVVPAFTGGGHHAHEAEESPSAAMAGVGAPSPNGLTPPAPGDQ